MTIHCKDHDDEIVQMYYHKFSSTRWEWVFGCPKCGREIIMELDEKEEQCLTKQKEPASRAE